MYSDQSETWICVQFTPIISVDRYALKPNYLLSLQICYILFTKWTARSAWTNNKTQTQNISISIFSWPNLIFLFLKRQIQNIAEHQKKVC